MTRVLALLVVFGGLVLVSACSDRAPIEGQYPGECVDGIDNDEDDSVDCDDSDCVRAPDCASPEEDDDDDDTGADDDDTA
ncbi:MAG TPA: hypothetical protein DIU15_16225, partial [Deltaproteobacteria bacterium]|nr:hypothetical protein [Deltaproteobacteria bacterium]